MAARDTMIRLLRLRSTNQNIIELDPQASLNLTTAQLIVEDAADATKKLQLNITGLPTATTRTLTVPATNGLGVVHQLARIDLALNLTDDNSAQALFPAANDALTVLAGQQYRFRCVARLTKGANSVSLSFLFGGTATFTTVNYVSHGVMAASGTAAASSMNNGEAATAVAVAAAGTGVNVRLMIEGEFEVNATGTLIPQVQFSGATGATPSVNVGSFFECWAQGLNPVTAIGAWA